MNSNIALMEKQESYSIEKIKKQVVTGEIMEGEMWGCMDREKIRYRKEREREVAQYEALPKYWTILWTYLEWLIIFQVRL